MKKFITLILTFISSFSFTQDITAIENEIYKTFNKHKVAFNGNSVTLKSTLSNPCREHSKFMGENNSLEHVGINEMNAKSEIIQQNHIYERTNQEVAKAVLTAFLNSPSHKELLEEKSTYIGIGVHITDGHILWVTVRFL